jgi:hypothetical protein
VHYDAHGRNGTNVVRGPAVVGHEGFGVIAEVGPRRAGRPDRERGRGRARYSLRPVPHLPGRPVQRVPIRANLNETAAALLILALVEEVPLNIT